MLAFSGHKIHALSGIGVLLIAPQMKLSPMLLGGGQQGGSRSGTEHIHGIASLQYVFKKILADQLSISQTLRSYRDTFESRIREALPDSVVLCQEDSRVSNLSAIAFPGLEGEVLQIALDLEGVACGFGSACSSGTTSVFKSLTAMKVPREISLATLRFSFIVRCPFFPAGGSGLPPVIFSDSYDQRFAGHSPPSRNRDSSGT